MSTGTSKGSGKGSGKDLGKDAGQQAEAAPSLALRDELYAAAESGAADGDRARVDPEELVRSVGAIGARVRDDPDTAAKLAKRGANASFFASGAALASDLSALTATLPPDFRRIELKTPEQRHTVATAAETLKDLKESATEAAISQSDATLVRLLGRGQAVRADHLGDVYDGIGRVVQRKPMRAAGRAASTDEIARAQLAVESWLEDLGGDATWGLEDDTARTRVLGVLPRTPDRRKRAVENPPVEGAPKGEVPATEAGKSETPPAETPKK